MSTSWQSMIDRGQPTSYDGVAPDRQEKSAADKLRVGVVGYGYWGPNIVRNLSNLDNVELVAVCDQDTAPWAVPAARVRGFVSRPTCRTSSGRLTSTPLRL